MSINTTAASAASVSKPRRKTQEVRSMETQERIIQAATEVLRQKGYAGLRVADVTSVAGVSRGAQSHHFHTKVEIVLAVMTNVFEQATTDSQARIAAIQPEDNLMEALIADASAFFLGPDFSLGLDMLGAGGRDPELRSSVQEIARSNRFKVESRWISLLEQRGLAHSDAEDVLWLVFNAIRGLSVRQLWQLDLVRFERVKALTLTAAMELYHQKLHTAQTLNANSNTNATTQGQQS